MARSWDVRKGKNLKTFKGHVDTVWCLDVHDGFLYTGSADKSVIKFDAAKGKVVDKLLGHKKAIFCLAVSDDGVPFSGSDDKSVIKHGERVMVYKGHKKTVLSLLVRGSLVFSASTDKTVRLWDTATDTCVRAYTGHSDIVYCLEVADGVLYTGSRDGTARAWNVSTGESIHIFTGHTSRITCLHVADNDLLYTGSADGTVRVWDIHTGECVRVLTGHENIVLCVAMNPQGTLLFTGSADHTVGVWNARNGELLARGAGHSHWVLALDCSDVAAFSSSRDGSICFWDVTEYHETANATPETRVVSTVKIPVANANGTVMHVKVDPNASMDAVLNAAKASFGLAGSWAIAYDSGLGSETRVLAPSASLNDVPDVLAQGSASRLVVIAHPDSISAADVPSSPTTTNAASAPASSSSDAAAALRAENARLRAALSSGDGAGNSGGGGGGGADPALLAAAEKGVRDAEAKVEALATKLQAAKARIVELEKDLAAAEASASSNAAAGEAAVREQLAAAKAAAREERTRMEAEIERVSTELASTKSELADAQASVAALKAKYADLKASTAAFEAEREAAAATKAQLTSTMQELAAQRAEVNRLKADNTKEKKLRIKLHNEIEDMKGKIRVYARVRPFTASDGAEGGELVCDVVDDATLVIHDTKKDREFVFTHVFGMDSSQDDIFAETTQLVQSALDGFNVCIFAYGQTGSGKTYTMSGDASNPGITPRAFDQVFDTIASAEAHLEYSVSVYMFEIYNDALVDLLTDAPKSDRPKLDVKHDESGMVYISNITILPAGSASDLHSIMEMGLAHRHTGATNMNEHSSRSHLILAVLIESTNVETGVTTRGKLSLVDLAGSERFSKTGADGERMREAQSINRSLAALGNVISALVEGESSGSSKHIPYRSNKLSYVLSDSLGGTAKTLTFVNLSPSSYNLGESVSTLMFGSRVKTVTNNATKNVESQEVARLKAIIKKLKSR